MNMTWKQNLKYLKTIVCNLILEILILYICFEFPHGLDIENNSDNDNVEV